MVTNNRRAQRVENKQYGERAGEKAQHDQDRGRDFHHHGDNGRQHGHWCAKGCHILHGAAKPRQFWIAKDNKEYDKCDAGNQQQQVA